MEIENITMESNLQVGQEPHYTLPKHQTEQRLRSKLEDCSFPSCSQNLPAEFRDESLARSQFSKTILYFKKIEVILNVIRFVSHQQIELTK